MKPPAATYVCKEVLIINTDRSLKRVNRKIKEIDALQFTFEF